MVPIAYTPRWLYRFFAFIERLPVPGWLLIVMWISFNGVVPHIVAWQQGILPVGQINGYLAGTGLILVIAPSMWVFFNHRARLALQDFFKGSSKSQVQIKKTVADFNSIPGDWSIALIFLGLLWGYIDYTFLIAKFVPVSNQVLPLWNLISWLISHVGGLFVMVRTIRQVSLITALYSEIEVDVFNPIPIYALSRYASLISITFILLTYGFGLVVFPAFFFSSFGFFYQAFSIVISLTIFFAPLLGINRRMHTAKNQILSELGSDIKKVYREVHRAVQGGNYSLVVSIQPSMVTLKNEQELIQKIPTWPWQPETLRNLLTPMLLPVIVYLVQRFLGSLLGF